MTRTGQESDTGMTKINEIPVFMTRFTHELVRVRRTVVKWAGHMRVRRYDGPACLIPLGLNEHRIKLQAEDFIGVYHKL